MRLLILLAVMCGTLFGQNFRPIPWKSSPSGAKAQNAAAVRSAGGVQAYFFPEDVVFPHLATGNSWETVFTLVNMTPSSVTADLYFVDQQGGEMTVTIREQGATATLTGSAFEFNLRGGASTTVALIDMTPVQTRIGWAFVDYDATQSRLGGFATFRQKVAGRPDFEALVPMSSYEDSTFMLSVDEIAGFETAIAICNPSDTLNAVLKLTMLNRDGGTVGTREIPLAAGAHTAFPIRQQFPEMAGRAGTLLVESNTSRLSALGLRFNTQGGYSFSSIPVMNWAGFFPGN